MIFACIIGWIACGVGFIDIKDPNSAIRKDWRIIRDSWRRAFVQDPRLSNAKNRWQTNGRWWHDGKNVWIEVKRYYLKTYELKVTGKEVASLVNKFEAFLGISGWGLALLLILWNLLT